VVSTLKLTKIQIPNSDSDVLSFNSSTGIMTFHKDIQGEGTATTNLQQGLAKAWSRTLANGEGIEDSFNIATLTDTATGKQFHTFTNAMNNDDYAIHVTNINDNVEQSWADGETVNGFRSNSYGSSGFEDEKHSITTFGDLA